MQTGQTDIKSVEVLGVPLAVTDYQEVIDKIDQMIAANERGYICVSAVHTVMLANENATFKRAVLGGTFTVPDGMPLVWALRKLGCDLKDRVYGPDLMLKVTAAAATTGKKIFLYGGRDQAALDQLKSRLLAAYPSLQIAGSYKPVYRPLSNQEAAEIATMINSSGAEIIWVGLGVPRQELWMQQLRPLLDAPVLVGVGAAFDFNAGLVKQAPAWMQKRGLEWFFRLTQEPKRLWKRYFRYNPLFVYKFALQLLKKRLGR